MEDIERQLAAATLRAVRREAEERHSRLQTLAPTPRRHQTLRPRTLSSTNSGRRSVVVQRDVTTLTPLTREVEPRSFAECAYCLLYTSPSPRDRTRSRMPSSA